MGCSSCQMPGIEGYTDSPTNIERFSATKSDKRYECQVQKEQSCFYTAQGEMVCKAQNKETKSNVLGFGLVDRYAETPTDSHLSGVKEGFIRDGSRF